MQVVWFKRDLRVADNRILASAARRGPVLPLYIVEPEFWRQPDMSERQLAFVRESVDALAEALVARGSQLVVQVGEAIDVLSDLASRGLLSALWSHQETGNAWSYSRDRAVAAWCRAQAIPWTELQNHGVHRGASTRNGWANAWDRFMNEPLTAAPDLAPHDLESKRFPDARQLGLPSDICPERQRGGRDAGLECLDTFLHVRGASYQRAMSSPIAGETACSRLSPHLAWGTVSMREVSQAARARQGELKTASSPVDRQWQRSVRSFSGRLHWHCHFIQKLEDEPRIEFEPFHSAYAGLRPSTPDAARLSAWANGETGLPFLDACMRSLKATGWLNFRMRAMVMATASYHLWLDWRAPGLELARLFTDYEPGIHWSQVQMQSGTTGINTIRIYNPVKQGYDQDPDGTFTRKWVPELANVPDKFLQEPWKCDTAGQTLGRTYPEPVVDHLTAARTARQKMWAVRREAGFQNEAAAIQDRHGSRKSGVPNRGQRRPQRGSAQLELPLEGGAR